MIPRNWKITSLSFLFVMSSFIEISAHRKTYTEKELLLIEEIFVPLEISATQKTCSPDSLICEEDDEECKTNLKKAFECVIINCKDISGDDCYYDKCQYANKNQRKVIRDTILCLYTQLFDQYKRSDSEYKLQQTDYLLTKAFHQYESQCNKQKSCADALKLFFNCMEDGEESLIQFKISSMVGNILDIQGCNSVKKGFGLEPPFSKKLGIPNSELNNKCQKQFDELYQFVACNQNELISKIRENYELPTVLCSQNIMFTEELDKNKSNTASNLQSNSKDELKMNQKPEDSSSSTILSSLTLSIIMIEIILIII